MPNLQRARARAWCLLLSTAKRATSTQAAQRRRASGLAGLPGLAARRRASGLAGLPGLAARCGRP
eukprot:5207850-Alexandrium_andersonii.AAC.1